MNDEYLWQKTGSDPEIEKLEQKLGVLRHRFEPLRLTIPEPVAESPQVPRWRLALAFAFATPVLAATLIAALFIGINNDADIVFVESPELEILAAPPPTSNEEPKVNPVSAPKIIPQFARNKRGTKIRTESVVDHEQKAKDIKPNSRIAALTDEEKFAYRQLMLALSISSSKLKIVQDTINGNDNTESSNSTNQR